MNRIVRRIKVGLAGNKVLAALRSWIEANWRITANWLVGLLVVAFVVIGIWYWWARWGVGYFADVVLAGGVPYKDRAARAAILGQAGDVFGGINALFAAFALAGVGFASFFQYRSVIAMNLQASQAAFEQLFFHLLEQQRELSTSKLVHGHPTDGDPGTGSLLNGKFTVGEYAARIRDAIENMIVRGVYINDVEYIADLKDRYAKAYALHEPNLGPYFRSIYHIFSLIHGSRLSSREKVRYARIARATLSSDEVFMLAVNASTPMAKKMRPMINRYGLLKHARRRGVVHHHHDGLDMMKPTIQGMGFDRYFIHRNFDPTAVMSEVQRSHYWRNRRHDAGE